MFPSLFSHEPFPISSSFSNSMFTFVIGNTWPSATKGELWWNWGVGSFEEEVRMGRSRKARTAGPPISKSSRKFVCSGIFWYPLVSFFAVPDLLFNATRSGWIAGGRPGKLDRPSHVLYWYPLVSFDILWYPLVPSMWLNVRRSRWVGGEVTWELDPPSLEQVHDKKVQMIIVSTFISCSVC